MSTFSGYSTEPVKTVPVDESGVLDASSIMDVSGSSVFEQLLIDECSQMTTDQRTAFLESDLCAQLVTEGKMRKNTIVMLSKKDDMSRRTKMLAMNAAKEADDPLWKKLKKNREIERELLIKIMRKYGRTALKTAKNDQKDWIKNRMPANFGQFGGANRVSADASKASNFENKYGLHMGVQ